jgi:hypothetical protein
MSLQAPNSWERMSDNDERPIEVSATPSHRGSDPRDASAFGAASRPALRAAAADYAWLLSKGYAPVSSLKLTGDRYHLTARQRQAVHRATCSDEARARRLERMCRQSELAGCELLIDGFNVLTTVESALGGAVVLACRDETFRDIAGLHGTYRRVNETIPAIALLEETIGGLNVRRSHWLFDRPVSNSGRIRSLLLARASERRLAWAVELVDDPDPLLKVAREIVATADSAILDVCSRWFNLARCAIERHCKHSNIVDMYS